MGGRQMGNSPAVVIFLRSALAGAMAASLVETGFAQTYNATFGELAKVHCQEVPERAEQIYRAKASGVLKAEVRAIHEKFFEKVEDENEKAICTSDGGRGIMADGSCLEFHGRIPFPSAAAGSDLPAGVSGNAVRVLGGAGWIDFPYLNHDKVLCPRLRPSRVSS